MNILIDTVGFKRKEYGSIMQQFIQYLKCMNKNYAQSLRFHGSKINKDSIEIIFKCRCDVLNIYCHCVIEEKDKSRRVSLKKALTKEKPEVYAYFINEIKLNQYIFIN